MSTSVWQNIKANTASWSTGLFSFRFFWYVLSQALICFRSIVGRVERSETRSMPKAHAALIWTILV
ncbi:MAG: hypothetical protein OXM61_10615 [Candidatus Poribacteria bacterium]|nr:hypothetical protein [Candidatus Poribacteria bacterium]